MHDHTIILELSRIIYHTDDMKNKAITVKRQNETADVVCLDYVNSSAQLLNGLQAAAYLNIDSSTIYIVVRGADVGIGRKIFGALKANDRFIPKSVEKRPLKTTFQDWIYTSFLGSMGFVHLYQYDSLEIFYKKIKAKFPNHRFIIAGHSLGGLLAQRLYILQNEFDSCVTFAGVSPWWTLDRQSQKLIRENNYLIDDSRMVNYYSQHDIFRILPLLSRHIGTHQNVMLQPFSSRSNILANLFERFSWAHIPNYYLFDKNNKIKTEKPSDTIFTSSFRYLNAKLKRTWLINTLIFLFTFIYNLVFTNTLVIVASNLLKNELVASLHTISDPLSISPFLIGFLTLIFSALYLIPTLILKSKFKYVLAPINFFLGFILPVYAICFALALLLNNIVDEFDS